MSREIKRILVIKLGALGDFVLALAAARRIREAHPAAHITLLTTPPYEAMAKLSPYFNDVWSNGRPAAFDDWWALVRALRRARFDRVYDLQTSSRSSRLRMVLGPFGPEWSGRASHRRRNPRRDQMHTLERQADQLRAAGVWPCPGSSTSTRPRASSSARPSRALTPCWSPARRKSGPRSAGRPSDSANSPPSFANRGSMW